VPVDSYSGCQRLPGWRIIGFLVHRLRFIDYHHPMEDRIILHDLDGDGLDEAFIPDSGTGSNRLFIFKFGWE
jgi:hypothetical protein